MAITLIEAAATLLWVYAALCVIEFFLRLQRSEARAHIPGVAELLGHLVPAMILLVIVVLFGALFGLPSVVVLIAVLFPAGVAYGAHVTLAEMPERAGAAVIRRRLVLTAVIGGGVIILRQFPW